MQPPSLPTPDGDPPVPQPRIYRCGSLTYTSRHLAILFFWLLWGDFCFVLMESVTGPIMLLKFQHLKASNFQIGMMLTSIPSTLGAFLNPVISFKSDRFRSRWGRRIPFIMATLPFLTTCLVLIGFGDQIGRWIQWFIGPKASVEHVTIYTFAALLILFTFFNTFVNSVFWYLFNDVVPQHLLARFMSWFRIISQAAGALYSFFIFPHSAKMVPEIMIGAAVIYAVGFTLMCMNVKEGEYPPPPAYTARGPGPLAAVMTFGKECHALPHYWYLWACAFVGSIGGAIGVYNLFFYQSIGLSLGQIGEISGISSLVTGALTLGSGWLADRYHAIRVVIASSVLYLVLLLPANMIWLFWKPTSNTTVFWVALTISVGIGAPIGALAGMWDPVLLMRFLPRSRLGQFCSTNNLWRTMGGVIGAPLAGEFLDMLAKHVAKGGQFLYIPVWQMCFSIPSLVLLLLMYRSWKRYGGDEFYVAPIYEAPPDLAVLRAQKAAEQAETLNRPQVP